MKREIKFRVFDREEKCLFIEGMKYLKPFFDDKGKLFVGVFPDEHSLFIEFEINQFTGNKDKNGKDVYEGDFDADGNVVVWCEKCNGWEFGALDIPTNEICIPCHRCDGNFFFEDHISDFEVIGNTCQNNPTNTCEAF